MKTKQHFSQWAALFALVLLPLIMIGCGGGGGGGGGTSPPPVAPSLVVQLRDANNQPVDGIVTVGTTVVATTAGQVRIQPVATGSVKITVEVNGVETSRTATVARSGPTVFVYLVSSNVPITPGPTSTLPPPPF